MGFQADTKDKPKAEQKESDQKDDDNPKEETDEDEPDFLKIGSEAPALDLEYWPTDNNGLLPPVKKFESGKTYVLNFFLPESTFTVSHLKSMVELQNQYKDKSVQVVCISSSDRDKTDEFLDGEVEGDKDADTYIDLLNPLSTAVDSKRTATANYIARAGMLTASTFIVGPTGKVEWIGEPTDVKKPLAQIVKGKWDRKAFAKKIEQQQMQFFRRIKTDRLFSAWMGKLTAGKRISAQRLLEAFAEGSKDPETKAFRLRLQASRMSLMLRALAADLDVDDLEADLPAVMQSVMKLSKDDAESALNDGAWQVYELYEAGKVEKDSELMKVAYKMAEKALKFSPKSGAVNDTVAHFVYLLDGDIDRAIKLQKFAVDNSADTQLEDLEKFLKFLKKEKATGKKKSLQKNEDGEEGGEESDF